MLLNEQLVNLLDLLVSFSRAMQDIGEDSIAQLFFSFNAALKAFLELLREKFKGEEIYVKDVGNQDFSCFYELYTALGGIFE